MKSVLLFLLGFFAMGFMRSADRFDNRLAFNNYLYVIDPTSSNMIVQGISYDDDGGSGRNASITAAFSSAITYYIVISQYDNNNPIEENETIDIQLLAQF